MLHIVLAARFSATCDFISFFNSDKKTQNIESLSKAITMNFDLYNVFLKQTIKLFWPKQCMWLLLAQFYKSERLRWSKPVPRSAPHVQCSSFQFYTVVEVSSPLHLVIELLRTQDRFSRVKEPCLHQWAGSRRIQCQHSHSVSLLKFIIAPCNYFYAYIK